MKDEEVSLPTATSAGSFEYGDPPFHEETGGVRGCTGNVMSSVPVRIVEFWRKDWDRASPTFADWVRDPERELVWTDTHPADHPRTPSRPTPAHPGSGA